MGVAVLFASAFHPPCAGLDHPLALGVKQGHAAVAGLPRRTNHQKVTALIHLYISIRGTPYALERRFVNELVCLFANVSFGVASCVSIELVMLD